jgi:hypothetical protein
MLMIMGQDLHIVRLGPEAPHPATHLSVGPSDVSLGSSLDCPQSGEGLHVRRGA